jgi:hypothetical protein
MSPTTNKLSLPDEVNVIKSYNDCCSYDTISDSDTDSDSDSDSESECTDSSNSYISDCDFDYEKDLDGLIEDFSTMHKPSGYRTRIVFGGYKFDGIASIVRKSDNTAKTVPISSIHTPNPARVSLETLSTDEEEYEEQFEDEDSEEESVDNEYIHRQDSNHNDDGYDYDELFRDNCDDDSSMSRFLRKLHKKAPTVYRVPSAAAGRTSPVSCYARQA